MAGEINFGILNTNAPMQAANAFQEGQDRRRKNRIEELAAQQAEQQFADDAFTRDVSSKYGNDTSGLVKALYAGGRYKQAQEVQKQQLEAEAKRATIGKDNSVSGKNKVETESGKFKLTTDMHDRAIKTLTEINSPQDAAASLDAQVQQGALSPEQALAMKESIPLDPAQFEDWKQKKLKGMMGAKDQLEFNKPQPKEVQLGNRVAFVDMNPNSPTYKKELSSQAVGMNPGTAAQLAQGERHFQANQNAPVFNAEAGGFIVKPSKENPSGKLLPVAGVNSGKPLTEAQSNALTYSERMRNSDKIISEMASSGTIRPGNIKSGVESTLGAIPIVGGALANAGGAATNWTQSANQQKVEQAQRDFINAVLRKESGAAIGQSEFDNARKQYFPAVGDSKEVLAQKAQNRALAIRGMSAGVPEQARNKFQSENPQAPASPQQSSGQVKFLGFE